MSIRITTRTDRIDYAAFTRLNAACFPREPVSPQEFQSFLAADFWVVLEHQQPIGFAVMSHHENQAHIRRIGIHPGYRRRGLGERLMRAMLEKAASLDATWIDLAVQQDNPAAIQLYRKFGFEIVGKSVQFSVPISQHRAEEYAILPIDAYQNTAAYAPHEESILEWAAAHDPPHRWVLVFFKGGAPIGFTRFNPDFPGCSPFELFEGAPGVEIQALISLLNPHAFPGKTTLKITTSNQAAITLFEATGARQNYSLFEMGKSLPPATLT